MSMKIKNLFSKKIIRDAKKMFGTNLSISRRYTNLLQNIFFVFCTKCLRDSKKMLGKKIFRFKKSYKFVFNANVAPRDIK